MNSFSFSFFDKQKTSLIKAKTRAQEEFNQPATNTKKKSTKCKIGQNQDYKYKANQPRKNISTAPIKEKIQHLKQMGLHLRSIGILLLRQWFVHGTTIIHTIF